MRILLLNPPGSKTYLRESYCSKISKGAHTVPPIDLIALSGILNRDGNELFAIDAIADKATPSAVKRKIRRLNPDAVVALVAEVSRHEDREFFATLDLPESVRIAAVGDVLLRLQENAFDVFPSFQALLLDYASDGVAHWLAGHDDRITDLIYRTGDRIERPERSTEKVFSAGLCRHDLFPIDKYNFPFSLRRPITSFMTDYGCPFKCGFCIFTSMPYRYRPVEEVKEEITFIKKIGVRSACIADQTFALNKKRGLQICEHLTHGPRLTWTCYSRVDVMDDELMRAMKRAGCHSIIFGVESGNEEILTKYNKGFSLAQVRQGIARAKHHGIRTITTFIIGLPGETETTCMDTIRFAVELDPTYASFNTPIPRTGTKMEAEVREKSYLVDAEVTRDQGGSVAVLGTETLSPRQLIRMRHLAERRFFFRPSYILRRLIALRHPYEIRSHFVEGFSLIGKHILAWLRNGVKKGLGKGPRA